MLLPLCCAHTCVGEVLSLQLGEEGARRTLVQTGYCCMYCICMYMYVHVYIYICLSVHVHDCTSILCVQWIFVGEVQWIHNQYDCVCMYTYCTCTCIHVYTSVHAHECTCTYMFVVVARATEVLHRV